MKKARYPYQYLSGTHLLLGGEGTSIMSGPLAQDEYMVAMVFTTIGYPFPVGWTGTSTSRIQIVLVDFDVWC